MYGTTHLNGPLLSVLITPQSLSLLRQTLSVLNLGEKVLQLKMFLSYLIDYV